MPNNRTACSAGAVYVMTNSDKENKVVAFRRHYKGTLSLIDLFRTQGKGTGIREVSPATPNDGIDPLASQGSLIASGRFLFAVNAGSNTISSFHIFANGELALADVVQSGGLQPNSLGFYGNLLYVSNVGSSENNYSSNITGFRVERNGKLTPIPGSERNLSTPNAQPARVLFSPNGNFVVVSELTTNKLNVYRVNNNGTLSQATLNNSSGNGPFGSSFLSSGLLLVAEAGINALSSYTVSRDGTLRVISGSVKNKQMATCWVVPAGNERYAYTSNAESGTISTYHINRNGTLDYLESIPSTPNNFNMAAPIDNGVSRDGRNLYVLNGNQGSISVFSIGYEGKLKREQVIGNSGIPELGAQGLAVH